MKRVACLQWIGLVAPSLLAVACSSGPSDEDYDDVAASVGALTANDSGGEVGSMDDSVVAAEGGSPDGLTASGSGSYQGTRLGLEYQYDLTCLDASGQTLASCGENTDTAHVTVAWSGDLTLPRYSASISRAGDWTLAGLQSDVAQFDGHGTFTVDSSFQAIYRDVTRTFHLDYDAQYDAVRYRMASRAFEGGQITYQVHAERTRSGSRRDAEATFDIEAVITFASDGTATLTLDGDRTYQVDLASGAVIRQ
jgi:hypothetical protein